jgi:hypothetical protein
MPELPPAIADVVGSLIGSVEDAVIISESNSRVYCVSTDAGTFVVKWILDPTVDALAEKRVLDFIGSIHLFRPLFYAVALQHIGQVAIAPFIRGRALSDVLEARAFSDADARQWACDLQQMWDAVGRMPATGFGRPWSPYPLFDRWTDFLDWYLRRQRAKAPLLAKRYFSRLFGAFERIRTNLDSAVKRPTLTVADVNVRNFLVREPDRSLVALHSPIFWYGDPAVTYAEASVHLDGTAIWESLLQRAPIFPGWRLDWYAAFAAYVILAFAERFDPTPIDQVIAWGGRRTLVTILDERLGRLDS